MPKPNNSRSNVSIRRGLLLFGLGVLSAGCVAVPVRMSPQVQGQPGVSADHTFITVGQTGREEVLKQLGWADMGLNENRLFWGRWLASSSGTAVVVVLPGAMGAERQRNWSIQNLMIEFDDRDIARRVIDKIEDKDVVRELVAWTQRASYRPANPSSIRNSFAARTEPRRLDRRVNGSMQVSTDSLEFFGSQGTRFKVPQDWIVSLKSESYGGVQVTYKLNLKEETPWGKEIYLGIRSNELLPVLAYITPKNP